MTTAVLPGSFDPVTLGHIDLIRRATRVADLVVVAVGVNVSKTPVLTVRQRVDLLREALEGVPRVEVARMDGLLVDFCRDRGADLVIKGIRDSADVSSEIIQASVNREIGDVETVFLPTSPEMVHVSSTIVRELAAWGMDVSRYVPPGVARVMADNGAVGTHRGARREGGSDV
ncbi:pantetheine-phosphate adenylyltransferase [Actinomyces polynesiensis]|uniref:pantetheine-phosphate adenylyltransferase n=1 Tax=Actinomyces polynesiensis TaxID=1325934 RepID=UPI0005BE84C3|nr:pantetheine-phosphate adenylyltransferase [Actinomyces polynesiensis]